MMYVGCIPSRMEGRNTTSFGDLEQSSYTCLHWEVSVLWANKRATTKLSSFPGKIELCRRVAFDKGISARDRGSDRITRLSFYARIRPATEISYTTVGKRMIHAGWNTCCAAGRECITAVGFRPLASLDLMKIDRTMP